MRVAAFISVAAFLLGSCAQEADDGDNFYAAKTISYIVATDPGGGYDSYARLIGKWCVVAHCIPSTANQAVSSSRAPELDPWAGTQPSSER